MQSNFAALLEKERGSEDKSKLFFFSSFSLKFSSWVTLEKGGIWVVFGYSLYWHSVLLCLCWLLLPNTSELCKKFLLELACQGTKFYEARTV